MRTTLVVLLAAACQSAWNNGQTGNMGTDAKAECTTRPYATHDWVADHALNLLPDNEKAWLVPN